MIVRHQVKPKSETAETAAIVADETLNRMVDVMLDGAFGGQAMTAEDLLQRGFSQTDITRHGQRAASICRERAIKQIGASARGADSAAQGRATTKKVAQ